MAIDNREKLAPPPAATNDTNDGLNTTASTAVGADGTANLTGVAAGVAAALARDPTTVREADDKDRFYATLDVDGHRNPSLAISSGSLSDMEDFNPPAGTKVWSRFVVWERGMVGGFCFFFFFFFFFFLFFFFFFFLNSSLYLFL